MPTAPADQEIDNPESRNAEPARVPAAPELAGLETEDAVELEEPGDVDEVVIEPLAPEITHAEGGSNAEADVEAEEDEAEEDEAEEDEAEEDDVEEEAEVQGEIEEGIVTAAPPDALAPPDELPQAPEAPSPEADTHAATGEPVVPIPRPSVPPQWREVTPAGETRGIEEPATRAPARQQDLFAAGLDEELVQDAIELVTGARRATATMLQRKLRIEYERALDLLGELAARGVVALEGDATQGRVLGP